MSHNFDTNPTFKNFLVENTYLAVKDTFRIAEIRITYSFVLKTNVLKFYTATKNNNLNVILFCFKTKLKIFTLKQSKY